MLYSPYRGTFKTLSFPTDAPEAMSAIGMFLYSADEPAFSYSSPTEPSDSSVRQE